MGVNLRNDFKTVLSDENKKKAAEHKNKVLVEAPLMQAFDEVYSPEYANRVGKFSGLSSGFQELDDLCLGFKQSDVVLLGAASNVGKTTFSLYIACKFAEQGKQVVYMCADDDLEEIQNTLSKIVLANTFNLDALKTNMRFITDDAAIAYRHKYEEFLATIYTLHHNGLCDWMFVDMMNCVIDPMKEEVDEFMTKVKADCGSFGYGVWLNCRLNKGKALGKDQKEYDKYFPDEDRLYGLSGYYYSSRKLLMLTPVEGLDESYRAVRFLKCKHGAKNYREKRFVFRSTDDYHFSPSHLSDRFDEATRVNYGWDEVYYPDKMTSGER